MNSRIERLHMESTGTRPSFSAERARLTTEFYKEWEGRLALPILRAANFRNLCEKKSLWIGQDDWIVGERGPSPKAVSSFPELTCHSESDLIILDSRPMTNYVVPDEDRKIYQDLVIPYWQGRSMRDRAFASIPDSWKAYYEAGLFTEFMEQRAPGHTALDGTIYRRGLAETRHLISEARKKINWASDRDALAKDEELQAMDIACEGAIIFARRHASLARQMAGNETNPHRVNELLVIAQICEKVPEYPPSSFHEAVQAYWFYHLGTITELNGWDAMSPGRLDYHLAPFYEAGLLDGSLTREKAKEILSCLWIKVNNTPAPPKIGVTAAESGTYNDFTNIDLGGLTRDGTDASSEVSYLALEVLDELQLLQPQANLQVSEVTPDRLLRTACSVIRRGSGYPSLFNADEVVAAQIAMGKSLEDAREGGTSGCVETGCFGKEAYLLHGYLNLPKILELALNDGADPLTGNQLGPRSGRFEDFENFQALYTAFERQLDAVLAAKLSVSHLLDRMFARYAPAPFLSVLIEGCVESGRDYYDGGAKYNTDYIQCVGLGSVTDSLAALKTFIFDTGAVNKTDLMRALADDWKNSEALRLRMANLAPKYGNDDDRADHLARQVFDSLMSRIDGVPSPRGGIYHINLLSTTCHIYFGLKTGATPDGRHAWLPLSDGTSPSHGADRTVPTAVMKSLAKLPQVRTGGTLLNQRFLPEALKDDDSLDRLSSLIRTYFKLGGHHVQFNIVDTETLRAAQKKPEDYRNLLVRVAGYSDYFVDLDRNHQEEIISRHAFGDV